MSQYFSVGDETLWNPSNGASRMFLNQVAIFEVELGIPSGLGPMEADECQVDPAAFAAFTDALLHGTGRRTMPSYSRSPRDSSPPCWPWPDARAPRCAGHHLKPTPARDSEMYRPAQPFLPPWMTRLGGRGCGRSRGNWTDSWHADRS